jgi:hypothetical protein
MIQKKIKATLKISMMDKKLIMLVFNPLQLFQKTFMDSVLQM